MGLFTFYLGYRKGKRAERRRASRGTGWDDVDNDYDDDVCDNCGHLERQHSDEGLCPDYGT